MLEAVKGELLRLASLSSRQIRTNIRSALDAHEA